MAPTMPLTNKGVDFGDFLVIRDNTVPAVLLENGYINSDTDFKQIKSVKTQEKIAKAIPIGLENYLDQRAKNAQ